MSPTPQRSANARYVDALCRIQAGAVRADHRLVEQAQVQLDMHSRYAEQWTALLDAGPEAVIDVLESDDEADRPLKADSPFAYVVVVSDEQRHTIREACRGT